MAFEDQDALTEVRAVVLGWSRVLSSRNLGQRHGLSGLRAPSAQPLFPSLLLDLWAPTGWRA